MSAIQQVLLALGVTAAGSVSTWNPADKNASITLSNANKTAVTSAINTGVRGVQSRSSGTYQFEVVVDAVGSSTSLYIGIAGSTASLAGGPGATASSSPSTNMSIGYRANGELWVNAAAATGASLTWTTGDVIGIVVDFVGGTYAFYKNGTLSDSRSMTTGIGQITGPVFPMVGNGGSNTTWQLTLKTSSLSFPIGGATAWG